MKKCVWVIVVGLHAGFASAAEPVVSGVPVGQKPGPYSFLVATGPDRGKPTCYICEQGDKPTAVVFVRSLSSAAGKLAVALDAEMAARSTGGFKAWLTLVTETADLDGLAKWAAGQGLKSVAVGAFEDADGPPAYKISADADVTVILFAKKKVVANFAFRTGELTEAKVKEIVEAVPAAVAK